MKRILSLLCFVLPVLSFCQGKSYSVKFDDLKNVTNGDSVLNKTSITINFSDAATLDNAKIIVTGVPQEEKDSIKLTFSENTSRVVSSAPLYKDDTLTFNVKDDVEEAKGKLRVFYKSLSKGRFQFDIKNSGKGDPGGRKDNDDDDLTTYIGALATANFIGNNKFLANLTPIVTLGTMITVSPDTANFRYSIDVNPYLGGQIDTKDSASFIPALMLPGRAGLIFNNYFTWGKKGFQFTLMPLGFGLKLIPNMMDSNTVIWQHNFRTGIAVEYLNKFLIGFQYTYGFHNTTSESHQFYSKTFTKKATDISYFTLTGQFLVKNTDEVKNYLFIEWRGLASKKKYEPFTNNSIITFGIRKDLSKTTIFSASNKAEQKQKSRPSIF